MSLTGIRFIFSFNFYRRCFPLVLIHSFRQLWSVIPLILLFPTAKTMELNYMKLGGQLDHEQKNPFKFGLDRAIDKS